METLDRSTILEAFERLDRKLAESGTRAQLYLVGGAVMCLALRARPSTKDESAWFSEPQVVRAAARTVAAEMGLPEDWLNDAMAFIPARAGFEAWQAFSHLDVLVADNRTLLAMKCASARTAEDAADIRFLAGLLGLKTAAEVLDVVRSYYSAEQLPVRTRLLLEEMADDRGRMPG